MTPIYDQWQTAFFFSWISNAVGRVIVSEPIVHGTKDAEAYLTSCLAKRCQCQLDRAIRNGQVADDWQIVCGPSVYVAEPMLDLKYTQTNAALVAFSPSAFEGRGQYIVAIAATNPTSLLDWLKEDFAVGQVEEFNHAQAIWKKETPSSPGRSSADISFKFPPCISKGTFDGVTALIRDLPKSNNLKLIEYLQGLAPGNSFLTFAGHSLAGALSPTLAMACLHGKDALLPQWKAGAAMVYPTAGATPGNESFARLFNEAGFYYATGFGGAWKKWNTMLWNCLDVIPHAWATNTLPGYQRPYLEELEPMYDSLYPPPNGVRDAVRAAAHRSGRPFPVAGAYKHTNHECLNDPTHYAIQFLYSYPLPKGVSASPGVIYLTTPQAEEMGITFPKETIPFPDQVLYQHVECYEQLILLKPPGIIPGVQDECCLPCSILSSSDEANAGRQ